MVEIAIVTNNKNITIESPLVVKDEIINCNCKRKGLIILLTDLDFHKDMNPIDLRIEINIKNCQKDDFCVLGLIEKKELHFNNYINIVPGWKGSSSIGYHSDDGSINYSDITNVYVRKSDTIKYNLKDRIILNIGFDGENIYFSLDNKRFFLKNNNISRWEDEFKFIPIIYFDGLVDFNIKIKL